MKKRIIICILVIAFALSGIGASKSESYKKLSAVLASSTSDCVSIPELKDMLEESLTSFQLSRSTDKILEDIYENTTALTLGRRDISPAEVSLYFSNEYYNYIQDPANADSVDDLKSIKGFYDLSNMQHGRKRGETWRDYFLGKAISSLRRTLSLAQIAVEKNLPYSVDEILSEEKIQEAEKLFFNSSPSCLRVSSSTLKAYIMNTHLASLAMDQLRKEYGMQYPADQVDGVIAIQLELLQKTSKDVEYTPFIKISCFSESDVPNEVTPKVKPSLRYKESNRVQLRVTGTVVWEYLFNNIVPKGQNFGERIPEVSKLETFRDDYGILYQFNDSILDYEMETAMFIANSTFGQQDDSKAKLVYIQNYYENSSHSIENLQDVYKDLVKYYEEKYGGEYTQTVNSTSWKCFKGKDDELLIEMDPILRNIKIEYMAKDEMEKCNELIKAHTKK